MGFSVVLAVLVVTLGRVGDIFGRVKIFNLGFIVFTSFSLLLAVTWLTGTPAALCSSDARGSGSRWAMLFANSSAIIHDAFPSDQRGLGLGSQHSGHRRLLHRARPRRCVGPRAVASRVPDFGALRFLGTIVAYVKLKERGVRTPAKIDWLGNVTFALGLILVLIGITYGLLPLWRALHGLDQPEGIGRDFRRYCGPACVRHRGDQGEAADVPPLAVPYPRLLGRQRCQFSRLAEPRGLTFMLIIWLQGIWLPLHGYSFSATPLWAGIYMIPLTVGLLAAAPLSGVLADRYGARPFATGGLVISASRSFC